MRLVKCISERKSMPGQIIIGNKYWIDDSTSWKDHDGDEYAQVYLDEDKENRVGELLTSHFTTVYRYLRYGGSLSSFINTHEGLLLKDIIYWCINNNSSSLSNNVLKYINDNKLNIKENMEKEFVVNSIPFKEFKDCGEEKEYMKYMGYSLYCID